MLYLVTDQENKTWRNILWGGNITHEESNSNYHFAAYNSPLVASFMYPTYDGIAYNPAVPPKIWEAIGEGESHDQGGFRNKYAKLTTTVEVAFQNPTIDQRMNFALLCAMSLILNPIFRTWAINYLRGTDQTKETAHVVSEALSDQATQEDLPPGHEYYDCAFPALAAVMLNEPAEFCANTAHRAYFDALDRNIPLDLDHMARIACMIAGPEIAMVLNEK